MLYYNNCKCNYVASTDARLRSGFESVLANTPNGTDIGLYRLELRSSEF